MRKLLLLGALLLFGCTHQTPQQIAIADGLACSDYGFQVGTDAWAQCRMTMAQTRTAQNTAWRQNLGAALQSAGKSYQPYMLPQPTIPQQQSNSFSCRSYRMGATVNTDCQ